MDERSLVLRIEGPSLIKGRVPFSLLVNVLKGVQETIYLLALSEQGRDIKQRARIPLDVQRSCELVRVLEKPGSYELVASLPEQQQLNIFNLPDIGLIAKKNFLNVINAVSVEPKEEYLANIIPDSNHRKRILRSIESYSPRPGYEWSLFVGGISDEPKGYLNTKTRQNITKLLVGPRVEQRTVTGELMRIHLDENRLGILYKPTGRVLDCFYDPVLEDIIIENLKGLIQVTGTVQLDSNGHPDKIVDVNEIEELDLSPVRFTQIYHDGVKLLLKDPIEITPLFENQEVMFELSELNIVSSGVTRDEAVMELQSDIVWLWKEYVQEDDASFSSDAIDLKKLLNDMITEVQYE